MEKLNIDQVAKLAHVSRSVVSRVLNNHPNVSEASRSRVLEVVKKYNYRPSSVARSLVTKNTFEIGILTTRRGDEALGNGFWTLLHLGIFDECAERGYFVRLSFISSEMQDEIHNFILNEHSIDGFILLTQEVTDLVIGAIKEREIPAVLVGHDPDHPDLDSIDVDNYSGAQKAVNHLVKLGHTRIGGIFASTRMQESKQRLHGYREAIKKHDIEECENLVSIGDYSLKCGYDTMNRWIDDGLELTALFCASDTLAMGALLALNENGFLVPGDMAVIGFDNLPFAQYTIPPLTTVQQPIYGKGQRAAELLIRKLEKKNGDVIHENLEPELVIRKSCGGG